MSSRTLTVVQGREGFDAIEPEWLALTSSLATSGFYNHPYWFGSHLEHYEDTRDFFLVCVRRAGALTGVLPIACAKPDRLGSCVLSVPVRHSLYMADAAIHRDEDCSGLLDEALEAVAAALGGRWDGFLVAETLADSSLCRLVHLARNSLTHQQRFKSCCHIPITDYDQAIRNLNKKFRGNLNNARHRLDKTGSAEFILVNDPAGIEQAFDEFVELEKVGWKGDKNTTRAGYSTPSAIALSQSKYGFFRCAVKAFSTIGCAEISLIRAEGKTVGAQINLLLNGTSYLIKTAYDESRPAFSAGHLLIDYACRRYSASGEIRRLNLVSDYPWFRNWQPERTDYVRVRRYNRTPRGYITHAARRARLWARRIRRTSALATRSATNKPGHRF